MVRREFLLLGAGAAVGCFHTRPRTQKGQGPARIYTVRLITVPESTKITAPGAVGQLVGQHNATPSDVFIVRDPDTRMWFPKSWLRNSPDVLVNHDQAIRGGRTTETVTVLNIERRDQVRFTSTVPFRVDTVEKKLDPDALKVFPSDGVSPVDPFNGALQADKVLSLNPRLSGPPENRDYDQLYKITFILEIGGVQMPIDPDVYCEWGGGGG